MRRCVIAFGLLAASATVSPTLAASGHPATSLNGAWRFEYSCARATGLYAERCASGDRDNFKLSLAQGDHGVCGSYEVTAQLGNHVDDGDLNDWTFTPTADQAWNVHFHMSGTTGEAVLRVDGKKLLWKTLSKQDHDEGQPLTWSFSPPDSATLIRQATDAGTCPQ